MKIHLALLAAAFLVATGSRARSQTLDWGSEVFSNLYDSKGQTLDNAFVFEIGAFVDGFVPETQNVSSWLANWRVFDRAAYAPGLGYFTKWSTETDTLRMMDDGTSNSPYMTPGSLSFEGLNAYLWIRKGDLPEEGSEWLLTRADNWVFPTATPGCCDNETPVQWSVSDLDDNDTPVWGRQGGYTDQNDPYVSTGSGVFTGTGPNTYPGSSTLQTFTFVPEPSTLVMTAFAGCGMALRRRRPQ